MTGGSGSQSRLRVAVSGYYGCGNAGDEAVLAGIRGAFARRGAGIVELLALSQNPLQTQKLHGIEAVDRMNLPALRRTLRGCDLLLSGGGSLLQDSTSVRSLLYYLWVARLAYSQGVPVMFYAQGLGPLRRAISRRLVRLVANHASYVTVRDAPSAALLAAIGVSRPPVEVTADPAFALDPSPSGAVQEAARCDSIPIDEPCVGVALRPWGAYDPALLREYAALLEALEKSTLARVVLLPMHWPQDVQFAEAVAGATGRPERFAIVRNTRSPGDLLGIVGQMQAVVAMRLHALIFAARTGVPPFALAYDPKVNSLMSGLGLGGSVEHWRGFEPEDIAERVAGLVNEREKRSAALSTQAEDLEQRALRNADCAMGVLNGGSFSRGRGEA